MADSATILRTNRARTNEIRAELREIDSKATAERRDYTAAEKARITEAKAELERHDRVIDHHLGVAAFDEEHRSGKFAGLTASGPEAVDGLRTIGAAPRIGFDPEALRNLHGDFVSHRAGQIPGGYEERAVTAVPMSTVPGYQFMPVSKRREPTRLADHLPTQKITAANVTYFTANGGADSAAAVAEGAAKPASSPGWTSVNTATTKIAHYVDVSWESLADFADFYQVVTDELVRGLISVENTEILSGSGTAPHLKGLLNVSGILTYAPGSAEARYKSLLHAITLLRNGTSFAEPNVMVINPADLEILASTVTSGSGQLLVSPDPQTGLPGRLWGVDLVVTSGITSGTALVAATDIGTVLFSRMAPQNFVVTAQQAAVAGDIFLSVDPYSGSANNLVRVLCEERIALGVTRPTALCSVTFNGTT